ncbi:MAG: MarR family winged helix-turn-helix transcriptional regulator [Sphingosinicella sp.]
MASTRSDEFHDVANRLHRASIRLLRTLRREDQGSGLSGSRLSALSVIAFGGPTSLAALAEAEQVRPPTMSRIVEALVAAGLVTREIDPDDRRSIRLEATAKGRRLMEAGRERRVKALSARIALLVPSEQRALARGAEVLEQLFRR